MKKLNSIHFIVLFFAFNSQISFAENKCVELFINPIVTIDELKTLRVTTGLVKVFNKNVPVVLVNKESVRDMKQLFNSSIGIVVAHQKDYKNDHGLLRLGEYFIDRDSPGARRSGEIHATGISFAHVADYTAYTYKLERSYNRIEVLFSLSKQEYRTAIVYQKMRRAGIIRPDFSFGGARNPKEMNNRLEDCGEICFSFSTGSSARSQASSAQRYVQKMGLTKYEQIFKTEEFQDLFLAVDDLLWNANLSEAQLNPDMFSKLKIPNAVLELKLPPQENAELLRWIVGAKISADYARLLSEINISNSSDFSNVRSGRASAVLVYDGKVTKEQFSSSDYVSAGVFSTWKNTDFDPIHTEKKQWITELLQKTGLTELFEH